MVSAPQSSVASARLPSSSSKRMEAVGQSTALLSAYLLKQSAGKWKRKRWNQRWFVLDRDNGVLRYFRHASPLEAVPLRSDAHGVLALKQAGASLVVQGDLPAGVPTPFCFTVVVDGQKEVRLCADTNAEFRQWTTAISAIISPVRAGSRTGEAKVAPARAVSPASSSSSAAELPSPLQSPVQEVKKVEVEVEEDTETVNEEVGVEPRQVMEQVGRGSGDLDLFIVNCQVPSYQPSNPLWGEKQGDGPGFNFVTYFAIPPAIRKMLDAPGDPPLQAVRLLKGFMQPQSWVSERFKAIGIVVNPEEQKLGRAERHLLETYNGQPILTRPQHQFYRGNGYFEVDVNA
ncbi:hypothetical protein PF004_g28606, partial [Phytophthora fragariae]